MTEITAGIHLLKLPMIMEQISLNHNNAYLVQGDGDFLLVDTGWNIPEALEVIRKEMAEIGAGIKDIAQIVVTHIHPDHYGQAGYLKRVSGAKLLMHHLEKDLVASRYIDMNGLLIQTGQWLAENGVPPGMLEAMRDATVGLQNLVTPVDPDVILYGGETITCGAFTFKVIWTPGHSSGHICLYEPQRKVLLSGDHILPTITSNVGSHPQSIDNPLGRYLDSLRELRKLEVDLVLPGHDAPFTALKPRIDELTRHHEEREREVVAALQEEATAYRVATTLTWSTASWPLMPPFHQRLAISETIAHLERLAAGGQIRKTLRGGVIYYRQN